MKILMATNTYTPFLGGVERSISTFTNEYRRQGHKVLIVAPEYDGRPEQEKGVIRMPAIQNFNGSDFSVRLPVPGFLNTRLQDFSPDIVHSHHPYLMGDTALRMGTKYSVPVIFTFHTFYEHYTHYVNADNHISKNFIIELSTIYSNLCDHLLAPSSGVRDTLVKRGVNTPIDVLPTGVDVDSFSMGNGSRFRESRSIPENAFVIGVVSRLAPEKNIAFISKSVLRYIESRPHAQFLLVGNGPLKQETESIFSDKDLSDHLIATGALKGTELADAYSAMDVFAFASHTETQGIVLLEAMAAGTPVVAVRATGINDVVADGENGFLLQEDDMDQFICALEEIANADANRMSTLCEYARNTARNNTHKRCASRALDIYTSVIEKHHNRIQTDTNSTWKEARQKLETELEILKAKIKAVGTALTE